MNTFNKFFFIFIFLSIILLMIPLTRIRYNFIDISIKDTSSQGLKYIIKDYIIYTFIPETEKFFDFTYKMKNIFMYSHDISSHLGQLLIALVVSICSILTIKWSINRVIKYKAYRAYMSCRDKSCRDKNML